ncbi:MAG: SWIM zinc finger family protein [Lewinellaceae bacterium]|nr:SWIM zinc finger family protein [Lewinellaceae bacterium]
MFSLDNFESLVPAKILARGLAYFNERAVERLEETTKGQWEAVVAGSEDYEVEITLAGKQVKAWSCDCPYDGGPVCKHVVAVLYALREAAPAKARKGKTKAPKMSFEDILLQLDIEELREFIRYQKAQGREFGEQFMLFFSDKDPGMDVEKKYREMVRQLARRHSDRGFMDYRGTFAFSKAMMPVLQAAGHAIARNNFREAMAIAQAVCLEVMTVQQACDDSAGNIGGIIQDGIQVFRNIANSKAVAPETLGQIYAWLEKQLPDATWFDYGDFGYEMLAVAESLAPHVDPERFLHLLDKLLESRAATGSYREYTREALKKYKIRFLQAIGREEEARQLIAANMDIVEVRLGMVEEAIAQQDFLRAKQLIAGGIEIAESKQHPGTVRKWEEVLLRVAQLEGDLATFRFFAKRFAFDRGMNTEFYQKWKDSFPPEEWPEVIEQHIQSVLAEETAKPRKFEWDSLEHALFGRLAPIYIAEQQWERLLHLIPPDPDEHILSQVHPYLARNYPKEMLPLYRNVLKTMADKAGNRGEYQRVAALMKKIKQDIEGSHAAIDELAASLIQQYPRRPAMREELGRVLK